MIIKKDSWHYKVYTWFKGYPPKQSNLCPYCRTVFLWAPLKFLFATGRIWKLYVAPLTYAILLQSIAMIAGIYSYKLKVRIYWAYGLVFIILATSATVISGMVWLTKLIEKRKDAMLKAAMTEYEWKDYTDYGIVPGRLKRKKWMERVLIGAMDIATRIPKTLIWQYIKAKHEKVCPMITFE